MACQFLPDENLKKEVSPKDFLCGFLILIHVYNFVQSVRYREDAR